MLTELSQEIPKYCCQICDIKTNNKKDFNKHILTLKHKSQQMATDFTSKNITCECGRNYKDRSGLWKHKKTCKMGKDERCRQG